MIWPLLYGWLAFQLAAMDDLVAALMEQNPYANIDDIKAGIKGNILGVVNDRAAKRMVGHVRYSLMINSMRSAAP